MFVSAENKKLQYCGRIDFDNPKAPVLVYAASFVKMRFRGTCVKVVLQNHHADSHNEMGYWLDGQQNKVRLREDAVQSTYLLAENLPDTEHELLFFKRQGACHMVTLHGFELDDTAEVLELPDKPKRRIEVFGDSVSCGEVSEALAYIGKEDPEHEGEFSNSWYSYAWMTARKLEAQLHDTSQGGIALLDKTGWFHGPDYLGVESCYDKITYNPDLGNVKTWDFSNYTPHVVIIAIGQNDNHPFDYMAEDYHSIESQNWRTHYEAFVRKLMEIYPSAQIILTTTILIHDKSWDDSIAEVCRKIKSSRVHHFLYKRNGCGTPGHVRIPEAEEMAEELSSYIAAMGEEIWK